MPPPPSRRLRSPRGPASPSRRRGASRNRSSGAKRRIRRLGKPTPNAKRKRSVLSRSRGLRARLQSRRTRRGARRSRRLGRSATRRRPSAPKPPPKRKPRLRLRKRPASGSRARTGPAVGMKASAMGGGCARNCRSSPNDAATARCAGRSPSRWSSRAANSSPRSSSPAKLKCRT